MPTLFFYSIEQRKSLSIVFSICMIITSFSTGDSFVSSPLRDGLFEDFCSFLEWILDVRLTGEARDLIRDLIHFWSTNNQMESVERD